MRVISIDPGYDRLGVAVMDNESGRETLLYSTCITTSKEDALSDRLLVLGTEFLKILETYRPTALGIETLFFNKNIKTAMGVAQARGVLLFLSRRAGCELYEFGPQAIKTAVTGYGKSDKKAVVDMIKRLVKNAPETAFDDEYDAIAVALTCLATYGRSR